VNKAVQNITNLIENEEMALAEREETKAQAPIAG